MTASQKAVSSGFDSLREVARLYETSTDTLNRVNKKSPKKFEAILIAAFHIKVSDLN